MHLKGENSSGQGKNLLITFESGKIEILDEVRIN